MRLLNNMEEIKKYFDDVCEMLMEIPSNMERLEYIVEYSSTLPLISSVNKVPENKVPGCISNVYIHSFKDESGKIIFSGSSEALIVKGYLAILFEGLSGKDPCNVAKSKEIILDFAAKSNMKSSLSPSRANAFLNVVELIIAQAKKLC